MDEDERRRHLSDIQTRWTMIFRAHGGHTQNEVSAAKEALMLRYGGAVHRYLLGALRDPDAADELAQDFAVRFLRGDFRRADPSRGRFRDFLKRALRNLMINYRQRRGPKRVPFGEGGVPEPAAPESTFWELDERFLESWREHLIDRAWQALERHERESGQPFHTVLRCRVDHPEMHSPELAEKLSAALGRTVQAGWVRQTLLRSRARFVHHLLEEVASSLDSPQREDVECELIELDLLEVCRPGLERLRF
jgi:RNA polymerase sigma-70 factor (ECF subfamily)